MEENLIMVIDRMSKMEQRLGDKMDRQTIALESKIDDVQDKISGLSTQNEVQETRIGSVEELVKKHDKVLFNGNNDGLVAQFTALKTKLVMLLGFGSVGGGAIVSLITSAINRALS